MQEATHYVRGQSSVDRHFRRHRATVKSAGGGQVDTPEELYERQCDLRSRIHAAWSAMRRCTVHEMFKHGRGPDEEEVFAAYGGKLFDDLSARYTFGGTHPGSYMRSYARAYYLGGECWTVLTCDLSEGSRNYDGLKVGMVLLELRAGWSWGPHLEAHQLRLLDEFVAFLFDAAKSNDELADDVAFDDPRDVLHPYLLSRGVLPIEKGTLPQTEGTT